MWLNLSLNSATFGSDTVVAYGFYYTNGVVIAPELTNSSCLAAKNNN